jgi:hypothetical protein
MERKVVKKFYSNGKIKEEYEINSDSLMNGYYKEYDSLGRLNCSAEYKYGIQTGEQYFFYKNGNVFSKSYFSNGVLDSGKFYDENGKFDGNLWPVSLVTKSDTIKAKDTFQVIISLRNIKFSHGFICFAYRTEKEYNSLKGKRDVTVTRERDTFRNDFLLKIKIDTPGIYIFDGDIDYQEQGGNENVSTFKHKILVTR